MKLQGFSLFPVTTTPSGFSDLLGSPNDHWSWAPPPSITFAFDPSFDALFPNPRIKDQVRLGIQQWDNANSTVQGANYSYNRSNGSQPFGDIRSIFVHELGHVLGLHHPNQAAPFSRNYRFSAGNLIAQADAGNEVMRSWINPGEYNHILSGDELDGFQRILYPGINLNFVEVAPGNSPDILIRTYNPSDPNNWANGGATAGFLRGGSQNQGARATAGVIRFNVAPANPLGFRTLAINWDYQNVSGQATRSFRVRTRGTDNRVPIFHYDHNGARQFLNYAAAPVGSNSKDDLLHTWSNPTGGDIPASEILHVGLELDVWDWTAVSASTVSPLGTVTAAPVTWSHTWNNTIVIGTPAAAVHRTEGISRGADVRVSARGFRVGVSDVKTRVSTLAIADVTGRNLRLEDLNRTMLLRLQEEQRLTVVDGLPKQDFEPDEDLIVVLQGNAEDLPEAVRSKGNFHLLNRPELVDRELFVYVASENEDSAVGTYTLIGAPILGQAILPRLDISKLPGGLIRVCWPSPANGYVLQHSSILSPSQWSTADLPIESIDGKFCITLQAPTGGKMEFFRLRHESGASSGIVGYLNRDLPKGFSMVANQFRTDSTDVASLIPNPSNGTIVYKYANNAFLVNQYFEGWDNPTQTLRPGEGAFIFNPDDSPLPITFSGNILEGQQYVAISDGFSIVSLLTPQENTTDQLSLPSEDGDAIYQWGSSGYDVNGFFTGWDNGAKVIKPGEAFWYKSSAPTQWNQVFDNLDH